MTSEPKDDWEKADVIGKWLVPLAIVAATSVVSLVLHNRAGAATIASLERDAKMKTFEVAVGVLGSENAQKTTPILYEWALTVFRKTTGVADASLPNGAVEELEAGARLPQAGTAPPPSVGPSRIRIIRLAGTPADQAREVDADLRAAGHTEVTLLERDSTEFPSQAEVRFYYPSDEAAATLLRQYLATRGIMTQLNPRTTDADVERHRPGDLHLYIR